MGLKIGDEGALDGAHPKLPSTIIQRTPQRITPMWVLQARHGEALGLPA